MSYSKRVGARLRSLRKQKGLTLQQVEVLSNKKLKGSLLAAYERGDRNISVTRLQQIARLYAVPVPELLPEDLNPTDETEAPPRLSIDLQQLSSLPERQAAPLAQLVGNVQELRKEFNNAVVTIRTADLESLASAYHTTPEVLRRTFRDWGVYHLGPPSEAIPAPKEPSSKE
jgi:transcriptional regulator with XRE-family HTH domain